MSDDIEPVIAVDEMIESLDLHADDVKPPADLVVSTDVDIKHKKADVQITERL